MKEKPSKKFLQLLELVDIVERHKFKKTGIFDSSLENNEEIEIKKMQVLYRELCAKRFRNDEEAAGYFEMKPTDKNYRRLRSGLKKKLLDHVLLLNPATLPINYKLKDALELYKSECVYKTIGQLGAKHCRVELSLKILEEAISLELTDVVVSTCKRIISQYSLLYETSSGKFDEYCNLLRDWMENQKAEALASEYNKRYSAHFLFSKKTRPELAADARMAIIELDQYADKKMTYMFHLGRFSLKMAAADLEYKWDDFLNVYDEAIVFLSKQDGENSQAFSIFINRRCMALIMLQRYEDAINALEENEKEVMPFSQTWYNIQRLKMNAYFHSSRFADAYQLHLRITTHPRFDTLEQDHMEIWFIFKAYLLLLIKAGHLELSFNEMEDIQSWQMHEILSEITVYSKDKRGFNVPILIAQVLSHLIEKSHEQIEYRLEALLKYRSRHLTEGRFYRTDVFIDLLSAIVKNSFDPKRFSAKATHIISKLETVPYSLADQLEEIEVLPYEKLYQLTLKSN
ncbi:MAG: hypothetical protein ACOYOA_16875 [Saprospiraceae bacterium]